MSGDAYARAGVSQGRGDDAVSALVAALGAGSAESRQVLASGHYANVVRIDDRTGIALTTDGVGTKLLVAEELGKLGHGRHRLRGDERERRDLRGR